MRRLSRHSMAKFVLAIAVVTVGLLLFRGSQVSADCSPPGDFGKVTGIPITIPSSSVSGNTSTYYRVWSRMQTPNATDTYMLEIDGTCYTIGGNSSSSVNAWKWVSTKSDGTTLDLPLNAGAHTIVLYGTSDGVLLDRVIFTQDRGTNCSPPTGAGDACANQTDTSAPTGVAITSPAGGTSYASGATIASITATASDDTGVTSMVLKLDGVSKGNFTASGGSNYTLSNLSLSGVSAGTHNLTATATDAAGNSTTSANVSITVASAGQADLTVTGLTMSPSNPNTGDLVTLSATVKNPGSVNAAPGSVLFKDGATTIGTATSSTVVTAGGTTSQVVTLGTKWTATQGVHSLSVTVDSANATTESNESNNVLTQSVTIYRAGDTGNDTLNQVNLDDLLAVLNNWNKTSQTRINGELSGDSQSLVDLDDLLQVLNNWTE